MSGREESVNDVLRLAIAEFAETGFVSKDRLELWLTRLRAALERELGSLSAIDASVRQTLGASFSRLIERGGVARYVPGVSRYTLEMVNPQLRAELDRRIMASADLIKLHRGEAVDRTVRRLSGWATSIPPGGAAEANRRETRSAIVRDVVKYRFERRRVDIDQSHKLIANVSHIVAVDGGAIAGIWHDHGEHDKSYNARKEHLARAGKYYVVRGSWAHKEGLINKGDGFLDEFEGAGQLPLCRCWVQYITSPRRLPDSMLTKKGREWIASTAAKAAAA